MPFRKFANPETNLFPKIEQRFRDEGVLTPIDLWTILKWKANRAAPRQLKRLTSEGATFSDQAGAISAALSKADEPQDRLAVLIRDFGFRLPTASAVLTVLNPDEFTIYDFRVCCEISRAGNGDFKKLKYHRYMPRLWSNYTAFKDAAIASAPAGLSLREVDHYLWGKSWARAESDKLGLPFDEGGV